jgi:hypothetical protein
MSAEDPIPTVTTGSTATFRTVMTNPDTGAPEDVEELKLRLVEPKLTDSAEIKQHTLEGGEIHHDSTGHYHANYVPKVTGLWHWEWLKAGTAVSQGKLEVESERWDGTPPDLTDLYVLVPRARRKVEGPWGNANKRPPLTDAELYAMIADACGDVVMLSGSFFHHELLVKERDPLGGYPTRWRTDTPLTEWETAIIAAQVALNYYFHVFNNMKISESIKNEGTEWTWSLSANLIRNYLNSLIDERDKAIAGLRINIPVLDRYASNIRVRDQATVAVLEWWAGYFDVNVPGGLPGGQEAAVVPVMYPPTGF